MSETPPGWYLDPSNTAAMRWWDGAQWTGHTQQLPTQQTTPHPFTPDPAGETARAAQATVDEHGDPILFDERTHGSAKTQLTISTRRFTAGKRSVLFTDVDQVHVDVTKLMVGPVSGGTSYSMLLRGPNVKAGAITQSLPLRRERDEATRQFEDVLAILETYLYPQLIDRLLSHIQGGQTISIGEIALDREGFARKRNALAWSSFARTERVERSVYIYSTQSDRHVGTGFQSNPNVMIFEALCERCHQTFG